MLIIVESNYADRSMTNKVKAHIDKWVGNPLTDPMVCSSIPTEDICSNVQQTFQSSFVLEQQVNFVTFSIRTQAMYFIKLQSLYSCLL